MQVKITRATNGAPSGKLADAELCFADGPLSGLKLVGFGVWEGRDGRGRNVTFPARQYTVSGERRHFVLLRPMDDAGSADLLRQRILHAYAEQDDGQTTATFR